MIVNGKELLNEEGKVIGICFGECGEPVKEAELPKEEPPKKAKKTTKK